MKLPSIHLQQILTLSILPVTLPACSDDTTGDEDTGSQTTDVAADETSDMVGDAQGDAETDEEEDTGETDADTSTTIDIPADADTSVNPPDFCHPIYQTGCDDPELPKCSLTENEQGYFAALCVPDHGDIEQGEFCERPTGTVGIDDCAPGNYCAFWGIGRSFPQQRVCSQICQQDSDCGNQEFCFGIGSSRTFGVCLTGCSVLPDTCEDSNTKCTLNFEPIEQRNVFFCDFVGSGLDGDVCVGSRECGPNYFCRHFGSDDGVCREWCNGENECGDQKRLCRAFEEPSSQVPTSIGACFSPSYSCADEEAPVPTEESANLQVQVVSVTESGGADGWAEGATVEACAASDTACDEPLASGSANSDGIVTLGLPLGDSGFDGFVRVLVDGAQETRVYWEPALTQGSTVMVTAMSTEVLEASVTGPDELDEERATLMLSIEDCAADGWGPRIQFGLSTEDDDTILAYAGYGDVMTVDSYLGGSFRYDVENFMTAQAGLGIFMNAPTGVADASAKLQGTPIETRTIHLEPGTITQLHFEPARRAE